jgi:hypothetical protein
VRVGYRGFESYALSCIVCSNFLLDKFIIIAYLDNRAAVFSRDVLKE